jgi:hypothetical protein
MVSCRGPARVQRPAASSVVESHSPFEITLHKARVVADADVVALVALFDVAAQGRGAAGLNGPHQFELMQRQRVSLAVRGAVLSKNVGQLQSGPGHARSGFRRSGLRFALRRGNRLTIQAVQRADGGGHHLRRYSRIAGRGVDLAVAEQNLNDADVGAVF